MECRNHAGVEAVDRCTGCAEAFCGNCLVEVHGQQYCGSCKVIEIQGQPPPSLPPKSICKEARDAFIMSLVGLFCFSIILEPVALIKATQARTLINGDPSRGGWGLTIGTTFIALFGLVLSVVGLFARFAAH